MWINDDAVEHSAQITLVSQTACMFNEFANDFHMLERLNSQVFWHFECHKYSYSEIVLNTVWHHYTKIIITLFPKSRRWLVETSWWFFFRNLFTYLLSYIFVAYAYDKCKVTNNSEQAWKVWFIRMAAPTLCRNSILIEMQNRMIIPTLQKKHITLFQPESIRNDLSYKKKKNTRGKWNALKQWAMKLVFNIIVLGLPASFWYTAICKEHENENVSIFQMCLHGFF